MLGLKEAYEAIRRGAVIRRVSREGVVVEGPGAHDWLQGQVSQDLTSLSVGKTTMTLVLTPQGKLNSFCRIWRTDDDRFVLEVEDGLGRSLEGRLRQFKLRVKAELAYAPLEVLECRGPGAAAFRPPAAADFEWAGLHGWDLLGADSAPAHLPLEGAEEAFEAARIEAGVPRSGRELSERTIPQEIGEYFLSRTVSFTKGCYTGQELVARLDARGSNVARRLQGVVSDTPVCRGDSLMSDTGQIGEVTSGAISPALGYVALAIVKRGVEVPSRVKVGTKSGSVPVTAEIRPLPLSSG